MMRPTDAQILNVLRSQDRMMTYVIRNTLTMRPFGNEPDRPIFSNLKTEVVRRRLMVMEKAGLVKRVSSPYAIQICWAATPIARLGGDGV